MLRTHSVLSSPPHLKRESRLASADFDTHAISEVRAQVLHCNIAGQLVAFFAQSPLTGTAQIFSVSGLVSAPV